MKSTATTVHDYLASLPEDRRAGIEAVREVILANLDVEYEEGMMWGMIGYAVPHRVFPPGHRTDPTKPLMMAALSSQKNALTFYLMSVYDGLGGVGRTSERAWFQRAWKATGKTLSMGGCCIRFRTPEHAALDVIGEAIRRMPAKTYVKHYVAMLAEQGRGPDGKKLTRATPAKRKPKKPAGRKTAR